MNLILWRHAEAHPGDDDLARELTHKGQAQASVMARWLKKHLPEDARILVSPAVRARQTVLPLGRHYEINPDLAPDHRAADLLAASGWPDGASTVMVVGHQPALGRLAAVLMTGTESDWSVRKGAIWWFSERERDGRRQVVLQATLHPGLLDRMQTTSPPSDDRP